MAAFRLISAPTHELLARYMNGLVRSKRIITLGRDVRPNPDTTPGHDLFKHPISGLTLVFSAPAATVTFTDDLDFKEIIEEINDQAGAEVAHLLKTDPNGGSMLVLWNDTSPVTLADTGTANEYFGFSTTASDPALVQAPVTGTEVHSIIPDPLSKQWIAFIYE